MSVKRYQPVAQCVEPSYQAQMVEPKVMEFSEGEYVLHSDYSRLKAKVENSKRINTELLLLSNQQASEVRRLKAEVERLTKLCQATSPDGFIHIRDINAAKDGKPSV